MRHQAMSHGAEEASDSGERYPTMMDDDEDCVDDDFDDIDSD